MCYRTFKEKSKSSQFVDLNKFHWLECSYKLLCAIESLVKIAIRIRCIHIFRAGWAWFFHYAHLESPSFGNEFASIQYNFPHKSNRMKWGWYSQIAIESLPNAIIQYVYHPSILLLLSPFDYHVLDIVFRIIILKIGYLWIQCVCVCVLNS